MKKVIPVLLLSVSCGLVSSQVLAERIQDGDLVHQYRDIQSNSQLFDFLQHYYGVSNETAKAMQSSMNTRQLEKITKQMELMNKNLSTLIALEKQRSMIKKG